jgi:acyl dehydratase
MIGTQRTTVTDFTIEAGKVAEFAHAVGDDHPVFHEPIDGPRPAPLAFTRVSYFPRYRPAGIGDWFGFDLGFQSERVLHGEQSYHYDRPVVVGDTLSATTTLVDVYRRTRAVGDPMTFCVFETDYTDEADEPVVTSRTTRIEVPRHDETEAASDGADTTHAADAERDLTGPSGQSPDRTREIGPVTRKDFVRFAGASGDFNPVHYAEPYATDHGHSQVFGQGMLTAGYASALLTDWVDPRTVTSFLTRFESRVWPGDRLTVCGGLNSTQPSSTGVEIDIWVVNQRGQTVLTGSATATRPDA